MTTTYAPAGPVIGVAVPTGITLRPLPAAIEGSRGGDARVGCGGPSMARRRLGEVFATVVLCVAGHPAAAQVDSRAQPLVRWPEALGLFALAGIAFVNDDRIRGAFAGHENSRVRNRVAGIANAFGDPRDAFPALALITLAGTATGADDLEEAGWRAIKTTALASGAVSLLKTLIGRWRPDISPGNPYRFSPISIKFNSMPSGHTATAFAAATSLAMDTKNVAADVALYGLATLTALSRMHVKRHWASDTVLGAGLGILAARFARRHDHSAGAGSFMIAGRIAF